MSLEHLSYSLLDKPFQTRSRTADPTPHVEQTDAVQFAAQSCAWAYMSSTLEDELASSRALARRALEHKQNDLNTEESDITDSRVRYDAERLLEFYDELHEVEVSALYCEE